MNEYLLLMHSGAQAPTSVDQWQHYLAKLRESGAFVGGSSFGERAAVRKDGSPGTTGTSLAGYIHVRADTMAAAKALLLANPDYEGGATVEIVELIRD